MNRTEMEAFESTQEYVGFWARCGASFIDSILIIVFTFPMLHTIYGSKYWSSDQFIIGLPDFIISWVLPIVVTVLFWIYKSATPGKMVIKARILDAATGNVPTIKQSIIRYFGYFISMLPFGLGFFWVAWDKKKQAWHDKLAGTVVIRPVNRGVETVKFSVK